MMSLIDLPLGETRATRPPEVIEHTRHHTRVELVQLALVEGVTGIFFEMCVHQPCAVM